MTPCRHPVVTLSTPSVGVLSHPVDTLCTHQDQDLYLYPDLRPERSGKAEAVINVAGLRREKASRSDIGACHPRSRPESLANFQVKESWRKISHGRGGESNGSGLASGIHQSGCRVLHLIGQVLHSVHAAKHAVVQHGKPGGSMEVCASFAVHIQGCEHHCHPSKRPRQTFVPVAMKLPTKTTVGPTENSDRTADERS